ncbi:T9SS type A sorting domain-containing protein [Flavobacterium sp. J27]|uniref:T9SS type A sorting domain-containing protein n=1 Tax=Flavobacterium sp. J27 TaxID=2060419 RepID=UPI001030E293|nr:T9SS type A sorting domain-containing protein [Flavobacterium sp. J27]
MKKIYFSILVLLSALSNAQDLELKGIIDFTVPEGGNNGKALHLHVINAISDLSLYGIGVANNGGGTDGQEYTFPAIPANAGDHILLPRSTTAMTNYMGSLNHFTIILEDAIATQNGDDAIELFYNGTVIETFGDIDCQASADGTTVVCPNYQYYEDAWAYKEGSTWIYGAAQCTDGSTTSSTSTCPYPFLDPALSSATFENNKVTIFPNPVAQGEEITFLNNENNLKKVTLLDASGRIVLVQNNQNNKLSLNQIYSGFYTLQIAFENKIVSSKLIVK